MGTTPNTIVLISKAGRHEEDIASGTITPGHLIELHTSTGRKVRVHSSSGGFAERLFAKEDALQGKEIDDDYSATNRVFYHVAVPGDVVQAWLLAGEDVAIGDKLISNGDGHLIETTGTPSQIIGVAEDALDLSGSGDVTSRLAVRVL